MHMQHAPSIVSPVSYQEPTRRRRRGLLAVLLGVTTLSLGAGLFSLALFTDTDTVTGEFATGTIDIEASPTLAFDVDPMMPGDSETAQLTIDNDGTADLRYALTATATGTLGDALVLEIRDLGTSCAAFDGASVLAATALDGAVLGDVTQGDQGGDRPLAAQASEELCFRVSLPGTADDTLQGETSDAVFSFVAEQVANNP